MSNEQQSADSVKWYQSPEWKRNIASVLIGFILAAGLQCYIDYKANGRKRNAAVALLKSRIANDIEDIEYIISGIKKTPTFLLSFLADPLEDPHPIDSLIYLPPDIIRYVDIYDRSVISAKKCCNAVIISNLPNKPNVIAACFTGPMSVRPKLLSIFDKRYPSIKVPVDPTLRERINVHVNK